MKKRDLFYKHFLFTKLSLVTNHMRYFELSRCFMMIFGAFQLGCSSLLGKETDPILPTPTEFTFEQYEVFTGTAKHQTI